MAFHHKVIYLPHSFYYVNLLPPAMPPAPSLLNPCAPPFLPAPPPPPPPPAAFLPPPPRFRLRHGVHCYRPFRLGKKAVEAKRGAAAPAAAGYGGGRIRGFVPPRLMPKPREEKEEERPPQRRSEKKLLWVPKDYKPPSPAAVDGCGGGDQGGAHASGLTGNTTVMMRNIPNLLKRQDLIGMLDEHCRKVNATRSKPKSEYDFVYLPIDYTRKMNKGYAFVNFTSADAAVKMRRAFDGFKWEGLQWRDLRFGSKKICQVCAATTQGKAKLVHSFRHRTFPSEEYQPVVAADIPRDGTNGAALILVGNRAST